VKDLSTPPRLTAINRRQMVFRSVDVEQLIDDDHSARLIWELVGRLDLSMYYSQIAAVEGQPGREHTDPQLLISLWVYSYSRRKTGDRRDVFCYF
jgi:transposase